MRFTTRGPDPSSPLPSFPFELLLPLEKDTWIDVSPVLVDVLSLLPPSLSVSLRSSCSPHLHHPRCVYQSPSSGVILLSRHGVFKHADPEPPSPSHLSSHDSAII